jgi:HAD superfamily hydrolase (TIGR01484 family)
VADLLGEEIPLVLHNGALIVESGTVLRCHPLEREVARRAIEIGRVHAADPVLHCGHRAEGQLVVEGIRPSNTLLVYYIDKSHPDVRVVEDLARALDEDPIQVMFGGGLEAMVSFAGPLAEVLAGEARIERTVYPREGVGILDVMNPSVNKAEALAFVSERWGIAAAETLAIGDNWNDHEMLEKAGLGFVMGNADPEMLRLGLPILPSNDEDGVAIAIERHVLNLQ